MSVNRTPQWRAALALATVAGLAACAAPAMQPLSRGSDLAADRHFLVYLDYTAAAGQTSGGEDGLDDRFSCRAKAY